jgi:hypothetical protein
MPDECGLFARAIGKPADAHHKNPSHRNDKPRRRSGRSPRDPAKEVKETIDLYLDGKIDQWHSLQGRAGVAFILNVTDAAAAHEMLEKPGSFHEL